MDTIISIIAFIVLTALWVGFGAALLLRRELLDSTWRSFRRLPMLIQAGIALLVLPVAAGLWAWETRLPLPVRLAIVLGLAWMTVYTFFPRFPLA